MEHRNILRFAGKVGGLTLVSRLLGMARDMLMAGFFGTSLFMSGFAVAFTVPNLFRRLFGEGALSAAFIPVFVETRNRQGDREAWDMARKVISLAVLTLLSALALGWAGLTVGVALFGERADITALVIMDLLTIMLPYLVLICLMALSMGILNSFHRFSIPAVTPALLNLVWIAALVGVCPFLETSHARIRAVAWSIVLGGFVQLAVQVPVLWRQGYRPGWDPDRGDERVRRILKLLGPAAVGMAVTQVNVMIDRLLAYGIADWAPAAMWFSERLIYLPLGLFATALGTVLLPVLSSHAAEKNRGAILLTVRRSLCHMTFVMLPAAAGLAVLAGPIIELLYGWGQFDQASVRHTEIALLCYAPGLFVFSLAKVFVPVFYAHQDTKTPVKVGFFTVGLKLALSITFVLTWPLHLKHGGLATATVLAEGVYALLLAVILHRRYGSPGWGRVTMSTLRSLILALATAAAARGMWMFLAGAVSAWPAKLGQATAVLGAIAAAAAGYFLVSLLFRVPEARDIVAALRRKTEVPSSTPDSEL